jgi:hypothetical protein
MSQEEVRPRFQWPPGNTAHPQPGRAFQTIGRLQETLDLTLLPYLDWLPMGFLEGGCQGKELLRVVPNHGQGHCQASRPKTALYGPCPVHQHLPHTSLGCHLFLPCLPHIFG